jgi:MHS family proline/betaine transporter-like MFS transporter
MATVPAVVFFPAGTDTAVAILATLAIYGVAFVARPLGALIFGSMGDRIGRRTTLSIVVVGMGVATLLTGLLPSYATAGVAAPILLVLLRLCQGLFAGGEFTGASSLIAEWAPAKRRGFWISLSPTTTALSFLLAVGVVLATQSVIGPEAWQGWGWRVPFVFGGVISMVGLYLRFRLADSPEFEKLEKADAVERAPLRTAFRTCKRQIFAIGGGAAIYAVAYYSLAGLMPTYLKQTVKADANVALLSNLLAFVALAILVPVCGALCDRYGRRPVLIAGVVGTLVLFVPGFLLTGAGTLTAATFGQILLVLPIAALNSSLVTTLVEIFPTHLRISGSSIAWNFAQAIFGGTAPLLGAFLVGAIGLPLAPAYYVLAIAVLGSIVMLALRLPETRQADLADPPAVAEPRRSEGEAPVITH